MNNKFKSFFSLGRKGDANMWWIIIGAVIALVVLIVLLVIFTSKSGKLEGGLLDCQSKGGECVTEDKCVTINSDGAITKGTIASAFDCPDKTTKCCFKSK
ncbi:hypothetical protein HYX11_02295 [Candidatus Woesearchaeota archaeon]|nr:hypothetical protein [Candidatus Woesearchaeota archaeon]